MAQCVLLHIHAPRHSTGSFLIRLPLYCTLSISYTYNEFTVIAADHSVQVHAEGHSTGNFRCVPTGSYLELLVLELKALEVLDD